MNTYERSKVAMLEFGPVIKPKPKTPLLGCALKGSAAAKLVKEANADYIRGRKLASKTQYDVSSEKEGSAVYVRCPKVRQKVVRPTVVNPFA